MYGQGSKVYAEMLQTLMVSSFTIQADRVPWAKSVGRMQ